MATKKSNVPEFKYNKDYASYDAILPNGEKLEVNSDGAAIHDAQGKFIRTRLPEPQPTVTEERIPLTWTIEYKIKEMFVTCQKITGKHVASWSGGSRPSSDGYRSGSEATRSVEFVKDTYEVKVFYKVAIVTNNLGEIETYSPELPSSDTISYKTGYGDKTEFCVNTEPTVPELPKEKIKVNKRYLSEKEELAYYWDAAIEWIRSNPAPEPTPETAPTKRWDKNLSRWVDDTPIRKGDQVKHEKFGIGTVAMVTTGSTGVKFSSVGLKILPSETLTKV